MKTWVYWFLTVAVALLTGTYVYLYLYGLQDTVPVVVATRDIAPGTFVREEDVRVVSVRRGDRHAAAVTQPEAVVGSYAIDRSYQGEQLLTERLAPGPQAGLSATLREDELLVFIPTSARAAVGGRIRRSDRIDVYYYTDEYTNPGEVRLLLQGLTVVQVVREPALRTNEEGEMTGVVVSVAPEQAGRVILALETGAVYLGLSAYDAPPIDLAPISPADVLGATSYQPPSESGVNPMEVGEGATP